ncbi:MAG: hypothetical protein P8N94_06605 [Gammaproteobacteria bacterium]|nr:hypothetical protein [Gammaproteobacteria bacterium]
MARETTVGRGGLPQAVDLFLEALCFAGGIREIAGDFRKSRGRHVGDGDGDANLVCLKH